MGLQPYYQYFRSDLQQVISVPNYFNLKEMPNFCATNNCILFSHVKEKTQQFHRMVKKCHEVFVHILNVTQLTIGSGY